jgi:hypothetical protein
MLGWFDVILSCSMSPGGPGLGSHWSKFSLVSRDIGDEAVGKCESHKIAQRCMHLWCVSVVDLYYKYLEIANAPFVLTPLLGRLHALLHALPLLPS